MQRASFRDMNCSIAQCLEVIGEWWTILILRDVFFGVTRFDELQGRLGISRNILNDRLNRLVDEGVVEKVLYQPHPPRYDYRLTKKGRALWPVLTTMRQWGDEWAVGEDGPPVELLHTTCGRHTTAVLHCADCGERLVGRELRLRPGPGAGDHSVLPDELTRP